MLFILCPAPTLNLIHFRALVGITKDAIKIQRRGPLSRLFNYADQAQSIDQLNKSMSVALFRFMASTFPAAMDPRVTDFQHRLQAW